MPNVSDLLKDVAEGKALFDKGKALFKEVKEFGGDIIGFFKGIFGGGKKKEETAIAENKPENPEVAYDPERASLSYLKAPHTPAVGRSESLVGRS